MLAVFVIKIAKITSRLCFARLLHVPSGYATVKFTGELNKAADFAGDELAVSVDRVQRDRIGSVLVQNRL